MQSGTHTLRNGVAAAATAALLAATLGVVAEGTTHTEAARAATHHASERGATRSRATVRFRNQMRKLWEDHIVWTRQFIVSAIAELPDTDTAAGRLLANQ